MNRFREHYGDGAFYDAEYVHIRSDLPLYQSIASEAKGPILELGCGTGRLSFPMAEAGATVLGIDLSSAMLQQAERRRREATALVQAKTSFALGDMKSIRLDRKFNRVVVGFNTLLHMLQDEELMQLFDTARAHLEPGGLFYFDIYSPVDAFVDRDPHGRFDPQQMIHPETNERYIVTENNHYDRRMQLNHMYFYYQKADQNGEPYGEEWCSEVVVRILYPRELDAWIKRAGFEIEEDFEDYERTRPFSGRVSQRVMALRPVG